MAKNKFKYNPNEEHPIRKLLKDGLSYEEILKIYSVSRTCLYFHARKIGISPTKPSYDWSKLSSELNDNNLSYRDLREKYGISTKTLVDAAKSGKLNDLRKISFKLSAKEYSELVDGKPYDSCITKVLKKKLIQEGKEEKCDHPLCGRKEWNGKKIPLQVDHIDGNSSNNKLDNIRFLCPNCHVQTGTWGNKSRK